MTNAAMLSLYRSEFDAFLYAPVGACGNDQPLSVLSALARLNVDPWKEAAKLARLSKDTATERLSSMIAAQPGGYWTDLDTASIAARLVVLLPNHPRPVIALDGVLPGAGAMAKTDVSKYSIYIAIALVGLLIVVSRFF
jgi:hypothetical protein